MVANPRVGQRVRLHYAARSRAAAPLHGRTGTVAVAGRGRPRNHLVELDGGGRVVVPCGNLQPAEDR